MRAWLQEPPADTSSARQTVATSRRRRSPVACIQVFRRKAGGLEVRDRPRESLVPAELRPNQLEGEVGQGQADLQKPQPGSRGERRPGEIARRSAPSEYLDPGRSQRDEACTREHADVVCCE